MLTAITAAAALPKARLAVLKVLKEFAMTGSMMRFISTVAVLGGSLLAATSDLQAQGVLKSSPVGRPPRHTILNDETYEWYLRDTDRYWTEQRRWFDREYRPFYEQNYFEPLQPMATETERYPAWATDYHDYYTNRNVRQRALQYRYPASGIAPPPPGFRTEGRLGYRPWR